MLFGSALLPPLEKGIKWSNWMFSVEPHLTQLAPSLAATWTLTHWGMERERGGAPPMLNRPRSPRRFGRSSRM
jgi:hypothetical protein